MNSIALMLKVLLDNWHSALMGGIIVACSVIFLMGVLKKAVFNRVHNKLARKVLLSFCSVALAFPVTALYFVTDNINFRWYWWGCLFTTVLTIVTYWLYENTGLRNLIGLIGELTVNKWVKVIYLAFANKVDKTVLEDKLEMTTAELKEEVRREIHIKVKEDKDLKGL